MHSMLFKYALGLALGSGAAGLITVELTDNPAFAMDVALKSQVRIVRAAIQGYHNQHGCWPGGSGDGDLGDQLCLRTDAAGMLGEGPAFRFGPYLNMPALPDNPFVGNNSVKAVAVMPGRPDGRSAWIYCAKAGEFRANTIREAAGIRHFDF